MANTQTNIIPLVTILGKQKSFEAGTNGIKINISHIAIGDGRYIPSSTMTELSNEKMRVEISNSQIDIDNYQMSFNSVFFDDTQEFWITEIGFFLDDGTLFAIWSDEIKALTYKSIFAKSLISMSMKLVDVDIDTINIIDMGVDLTLNYESEFEELRLAMLKNTAIQSVERMKNATEIGLIKTRLEMN